MTGTYDATSQPARAHQPAPAGEAPTLERSLGLGVLVLYGLGITIGAGIYVLIGSAAERAGPGAPLAFVLAAIVMGLTAASFAELAGRMPVSAGEAAYVEAGFGSRRLALAVGLLVIAAAIVAAAAITVGSVGYIRTFVAAPPALLATLVLLVMGAIAAVGMSTSAWIAAVMTLIEVGGLLLVVATGLWRRPDLLGGLALAVPAAGDAAAWSGVAAASLLAFFAFIGFEGLVNVAEEAHEPARTLPRAIFITLALATLLYILVILVALAAVPRAELAASPAPLALVFERVTGAPAAVVAAIAIVATLNGIIAQIVLAARVAYGLAQIGSLPAGLAAIHPRSRTPLLATGLATAAAIVLATALPIDRLADTTSRIMLVIFILVNGALVAIKHRREPAPAGTFVVPIWIPASGLASCALLLLAALR